MAKTKKTKESLKEMKNVDLEKKLGSLADEVRLIKFKAEGSRSKNVKEIANIKKTVARTLTEINSRSRKI
jgi:ribosomal protein L29